LPIAGGEQEAPALIQRRRMSPEECFEIRLDRPREVAVFRRARELHEGEVHQQIFAPKACGNRKGLVGAEILFQQIYGALPRDAIFRDARQGICGRLLLVGQAPEQDRTGAQGLDGWPDAFAEFRAGDDDAFAGRRPRESAFDEGSGMAPKEHLLLEILILEDGNDSGRERQRLLAGHARH
jgi:hypothetical protein